MIDWSERIPAAIEKADDILSKTCPCARAECRTDRGNLTMTEIALAQALWAGACPASLSPVPGVHDVEVPCPRHTALRAFVEKVEAL